MTSLEKRWRRMTFCSICKKIPYASAKIFQEKQVHVDWPSGIQKPKMQSTTLREKCPNAELFLVSIFLYSDWIRWFTPYIPVFSPNTGKHEPEITLYLDTFQTVWLTISSKVIVSLSACKKLAQFINSFLRYGNIQSPKRSLPFLPTHTQKLLK